jgi:hypothetical protein
MSISLNSACNCCVDFFQLPAVFTQGPPVILRYRSKSKSLSKCGFISDEDGKIYFTKTTTFSDASCGDGSGDCFKVDVNTNELSRWDGSPISVTSTATFSLNFCEESGDTCCQTTATGFFPEGGGSLEVTTWENEYTDEILLSNLDSLPFPTEFSDWGATIEAVGLSLDGQSIVETEVIHRPSISGYLKVWYWNIIRDIGDNPAWRYKQDSVYVWDGVIPDLNSGIGSSANLIFTNRKTVEAAEQTVVTQVVAKWSILEDYEPDDPIFNSEDGSLTRPTPDCNSNGLPNIVLQDTFPASFGFVRVTINPDCL